MRKAMLFLLLFTAFSTMVSAETADEFLDRNEAKAKALKSYETVSEMTVVTPQYQTVTQSTTEAKRTADGMKTNSTTKTTITMPNKPQIVTEGRMVSDGRLLYMETKQAGRTTVSKAKAPADETGYGSVRDAMKKGGASTVRPAEQVNGEACGVLEIAYTDGTNNHTYTYWISEKNGILMKMTGASKLYGDVTLNVKSVKTDIEIADSKFVYEAPAGVAVQDYTGAGAASAAAAGAATATK
ncbi:hypothetical protein IT570_03190 [Candidatus Sumerlaeota bacterium]|nr:hypothetical protein [Candidatus Sumerlaeota bacterium]